jgi:hypothetical protein
MNCPLPFKGRERVAMGLYAVLPTPIPTFPLRGKGLVEVRIHSHAHTD